MAFTSLGAWLCGDLPWCCPRTFKYVWEAKEWPAELWAVPNNCIICCVQGAGITALAGGDNDGDDVVATLNTEVVQYVDATEAAVADLDLASAAEIVDGSRVGWGRNRNFTMQLGSLKS